MAWAWSERVNLYSWQSHYWHIQKHKQDSRVMGNGNLSVVQWSLLMGRVIPVRYMATLYKPIVYLVFKKNWSVSQTFILKWSRVVKSLFPSSLSFVFCDHLVYFTIFLCKKISFYINKTLQQAYSCRVPTNVLEFTPLAGGVKCKRKLLWWACGPPLLCYSYMVTRPLNPAYTYFSHLPPTPYSRIWQCH